MARVVGLLPVLEADFIGIMPSLMINGPKLTIKGTRLSDNKLVYVIVIDNIFDCSIKFDNIQGEKNELTMYPPGIEPIVIYVWSTKVANNFANVLYSHLEKNE